MSTSNYWNDKLYKDEKILKEFSIGKKYIHFYMVLFTIGYVLLLVASIFTIYYLQTYIFTIMVTVLYIAVIIYYIYYLPKCYRYALTNKRILIKEGWASTHTITIDYNSVTDIRVYSSMINKLFCKTAMIYINTAGGEGIEGTFKHIENPYEIKKLINQQTNLYKYQKPNNDIASRRIA